MSAAWTWDDRWDGYGYEPTDYPDDDRDQEAPEPTAPQLIDAELADWLTGSPVFSDHEHLRQEQS